jgi:hypothetical protein
MPYAFMEEGISGTFCIKITSEEYENLSPKFLTSSEIKIKLAYINE